MQGSEYWEILQEILEETRKVDLEYSELPIGYMHNAAKLRHSPL